MKIIIYVIFTLLSFGSYSQEIVPGLTANNKGVGVQLFYQEFFTEGDFKFGPRVGVTWHPLNPDVSHFYWQNMIENNSRVFFIFILLHQSFSQSKSTPAVVPIIVISNSPDKTILSMFESI